MEWRKATASVANGACLEVTSDDEVLYVRDSKHPDAGIIPFSKDEFALFLEDVKHGLYDHIV